MSNFTDDGLSPTSRYNDRSYIKKNNTYHIHDSPWKAAQIDKIISRNKLNISKICDIGCGAGKVLQQLSFNPKFTSTTFSGYEMSKSAFDLCLTLESENLKFYLEDLLNKDITYDVVLCIDVFEHVENYMGFLKKLRHKGKFKIFHIPLDLSVSSLIRKRLIYSRDQVGHLHYFSPETAIETLKDCGYEIIDTMFTLNLTNSSKKSFKTKLLNFPRKLLFAISPNLMSTLIGGASLMVIAK